MFNSYELSKHMELFLSGSNTVVDCIGLVPIAGEDLEDSEMTGLFRLHMGSLLMIACGVVNLF